MGIIELASIINSKLTDLAPVFNTIETSFIIPFTLTFEPGVVFFSILGSTKSSFK